MITELDIKIIKELQNNLPLVNRPFKIIAKKIGISEEKLIEKIKYLKKNGYIRRFGAALRHREMGIKANAMIVWKVPEEDCDRVGTIISSFDEVTHCYQRPEMPDWPYNLFAMVHFNTKEECYRMAQKITNAIGNYSYKLLFSTKELKKTSMKYFIEDM